MAVEEALSSGSGDSNAALVVAAGILVLSNSIITAAYHISDVLWGKLLNLLSSPADVACSRCGWWREHSTMLSAAHRARAAVARSAAVFPSGFIILKFIVEKECVVSRREVNV